ASEKHRSKTYAVPTETEPSRLGAPRLLFAWKMGGNPRCDDEEPRVTPRFADELDSNRQSLLAFSCGQVDAGQMEQRPDAIEDRIAGCPEARRRFAWSAGRKKHMVLFENRHQTATAILRMGQRGAVLVRWTGIAFREQLVELRTKGLRMSFPLGFQTTGHLRRHHPLLRVEQAPK